MTSPKISVILDNYNYGRFVGEAIESVLSQTFQDWECIVVDDGSTDSSREIIDSYRARSPRICPLYKQNGGQMSAFNAAFAAARGEVIAFLDSDDFWYLQKLEKVMRKMFCGTGGKGYQIVQHYLLKNGVERYRNVNTDIDWHDVLMNYGYLYNHSVSSALAFSRNLLERFFPFPYEERMRYCADGVVLMAALSLEEVGFIEEDLGFYRVHGDNGHLGKNDQGERARSILREQHRYVNETLKAHGLAEIPFDDHRYLRHILEGMLEGKKLRPDSRIILYGTEASGLYLADVLEEKGIPLSGYTDSDQGKWGKTLRGRTILPPVELRNAEWDVILIASSAQAEIAENLRCLGFTEGREFFRLPL